MPTADAVLISNEETGGRLLASLLAAAEKAFSDSYCYPVQDMPVDPKPPSAAHLPRRSAIKQNITAVFQIGYPCYTIDPAVL